MADITEEQLKKEIAKILENADLAKTSTKKVIIQLEKNLGAELKDKKAIIDQLVMDYVNSKESGDEEASDAESEDASEKSDEAPKKKKPAKRAAAKPEPASDEESDEEETKKKKPKRQKAQYQSKRQKSQSAWRSSEEDSEEEKKPKKKGKKKGGGDSDDDWSKKKEKSSGPRKKPELPPEDTPLNNRIIQKKMMNLSVTSHQSEEMYRFMESHVELARGQMRSVDARETARKLWMELGDRLNALENGAAKTVHQWQRVWFDKKYIARKSALRINLSSNGSIGDELLDWEARVLAIIGVPLKSAAREDADVSKNFTIEHSYGILHNPPKTRPVEADTSQNSEGYGLHKGYHCDNFERTSNNDELDAYTSETHYNGESIQNVQSSYNLSAKLEDGSESPIAVEPRDGEYIGTQQSAFQGNRVVGDELQIPHSVTYAPTFQGSGYTRAYKLSPELSELMGAEMMPRHEVVKRVWEIIKKQDLYDPNNKQFAICNDQLYKVIGTKRFRTFGMMKYLKTHFLDD